MNSYTFNSNGHRQYGLGLIFLVFFPSFGLFVLGVFLEPLSGDLTTIGSYSEREFGWIKPQLEFSKILYTDGQYTQYHDIVVLGDSFSRARPQRQWQNYIAAGTDLSVVTIDIYKTKWKSVVESSTFRENPPKFFIIESVERVLPEHLKDGESCEEHIAPEQSEIIPPSLTVPVINTEGKAGYVTRKKDWSDVKLGFVLNYLWHGAWRNLLGVERTLATKVDLTNQAAFSSVNKREMLVFQDDFTKIASWQEMGLLKMGCKIDRIRKQVEKNGYTKFVLLVAPDKLTAYSDFLEDKDLKNISNIFSLSEQNPNLMPRIDVALTAAIRTGAQDVYLPDDTHWGSMGHQIVAETLLTFLRGNH